MASCSASSQTAPSDAPATIREHCQPQDSPSRIPHPFSQRTILSLTPEVGASCSASEQSAAFVKYNAVPMEFSEEDFEQLADGNLVTKAIFLPDPKFRELAIAGLETLVSTRTDPGVDAVAEAGNRGTILAILRRGNRAQAATLIGPDPVDARILLIRQRLTELDSGTAANSDPQSVVVWIEAIGERSGPDAASTKECV